jgi:hydrogenase nickel incorporation protein HypB
MCATCGCSTDHVNDHDHDPGGGHVHDHDHDHGGDHEHGRGGDRVHSALRLPRWPRRVSLEEAVLGKNDALAAANRTLFDRREIAAFNFTSSPGAGKTSLLVALIGAMVDRFPIRVVEGDQETARDAERILATGVPAYQINTGMGCHLDAEMLRTAIRQLDPPRRSLLMIENVGNLVCPALFDLGERAKIVVMSVTEGEDKPLKYPHMFRAARVLVLTKTDLLPHLEFDADDCIANALRINSRLRVFQVSARTGAGLAPLADWLGSQLGARG